MAQGSRIEQPANDRAILLEELRVAQSALTEGSAKWRALQKRIDELVARNFLEHLNA